MHVDVLYIIQGKSELREHVARVVDADFANLLCERVCIHSDEGGRTDWSDGDHTLKGSYCSWRRLGSGNP
jgi:hypothetical protein